MITRNIFRFVIYECYSILEPPSPPSPLSQVVVVVVGGGAQEPSDIPFDGADDLNAFHSVHVCVGICIICPVGLTTETHHSSVSISHVDSIRHPSSLVLIASALFAWYTPIDMSPRVRRLSPILRGDFIVL